MYLVFQLTSIDIILSRYTAAGPPKSIFPNKMRHLKRI